MVGRAMVAMLLLAASPISAQSLPEADYQADRHQADPYRYEDAGLLERGKPWTLAFTAPFSWQSNLDASPDTGMAGIALDPEISLDRIWAIGGLTLGTTAGLFISSPMPDPSADVSGWYATVELSAGDPATGLSPYVHYDPVAVHAGVLGASLLTRHSMAVGVRRKLGRTSLDLAALHEPTDAGGSANRNALRFTAVHGIGLGADATLQLRGDLEQRWYSRGDLQPEPSRDARNVTRARVRARAIIPLDYGVDLFLNLQWERHWSNQDAWRFSNITIGPTLAARFGF